MRQSAGERLRGASARPLGSDHYAGGVRSVREMDEAVKRNRGNAPTSDDVSLTADGRRIRTADDVRQLLAEFEARQRQRARRDGAAGIGH